MRTNEERIAAMHARAAQLKNSRRQRRVQLIQTFSVAACFVAILLLALFMPGLTDALSGGAGQDAMSASIFSGNSFLGFIVIGVVAFLLGAAVTIFCFRLRKWDKEQEQEDAYD